MTAARSSPASGTHVAIVTDFLSGLGGTERYTATVAEALVMDGAAVEVFVAEPLRDTVWHDLLMGRGVAVHAPVSDASAGRTWQMLNRHIATARPDLILVNPLGRALVQWLPTLPPDLPLPPLVGVEYSHPGPLSAHWYPPELPSVLHRFAAVIATCDASARGVVDHFGYRGPIHIVPHLIHPPLPGTPPALPRPHLGVIARISVEKGLDYALAAIALLRRAGVPAELSIYGSGSDDGRAHLLELTSCLGVGDSVHLRGLFHPIHDLNEVIHRHAIWLQPSLFESLPTALLEVFARGRTVIASAVGGIPEFLEKVPGADDLLVPAVDTRALADRVLDALQHPEHFARLARAVQQHVLAQHSPEVVGPQLMRVLSNYMGVARPG